MKRSWVRATTICLTLSGASILACSSDSGGSTCANYFNAYVGYLDRCGSLAQGLQAYQSRFVDECGRVLSAPGAVNADADFVACTNKLATAQCNDTTACTTSPGTLDAGAPCGEDNQCKGGRCEKSSEVYCGKCADRVAIGGECNSASECVPNSTCDIDSTSLKRVCKAKVVGVAGDACAGVGTDFKSCGDDLTCLIDGSKGTCQPRQAEGGKCASTFDCVNGLRCISKKCAPPVGEGAACEADSCANGFICNEQKCARLVTVNGGEACDLVRRCLRGNCKGLSVSSTGGKQTVTPGTCVDPLPDGADCTPASSNGAKCDLFAKCIGGKCVLSDPNACK